MRTTDATVEQQGETKRRRDHPEVPQAADSSSSSESSTDTEMGLVDVCTILCDNSEAESRERVTGKPVAVFAEGRREGGRVTLDLTKWDFNKADCRTRCRKLVDNSKPLLLMGSPIDSDGEDEEQTRAVLHLAFICELYEIQVREGRYFFTHIRTPQRVGARGWEAEDDVKGGPLNPHEVKTAPEKEIKYLWDMEVCESSTEAEARARTGRKPVGLKWIDTNKGSAEASRYRSRLVCTEVRHKGVEPIFSATPPLETLRVLISVACQEDVFRAEDRFLITTADVSRADFYADAVRNVYVQLPDEDPKAARRVREIAKDDVRFLRCCPTLGRTLCTGFGGGRISRGAASPCHFFHKGLQTYILVHGDDFFKVGRRDGRKHALSLLRGAHELSKVVTLGLESSQSRTDIAPGESSTNQTSSMSRAP